MYIPFDDNSGEQYEIHAIKEDMDSGDGIVLTLNRKACEAFEQVFAQLKNEPNGAHIHLGYDQDEPQGPGFKIVVQETD